MWRGAHGSNRPLMLTRTRRKSHGESGRSQRRQVPAPSCLLRGILRKPEFGASRPEHQRLQVYGCRRSPRRDETRVCVALPSRGSMARKSPLVSKAWSSLPT
eukprot:5399799-Alexandrium_andersonii.AAC.1